MSRKDYWFTFSTGNLIWYNFSLRSEFTALRLVYQAKKTPGSRCIAFCLSAVGVACQKELATLLLGNIYCKSGGTKCAQMMQSFLDRLKLMQSSLKRATVLVVDYSVAMINGYLMAAHSGQTLKVYLRQLTGIDMTTVPLVTFF